VNGGGDVLDVVYSDIPIINRYSISISTMVKNQLRNVYVLVYQ